jgi:hypothetical protein
MTDAALGVLKKAAVERGWWLEHASSLCTFVAVEPIAFGLYLDL